MTRETLENLVIESTGRSDKLTLIRSALDLAVEEVSSQRLWSDLQVEADVEFAANLPSVDLATDVARIAEFRLIDDLQSRPLLIRPKTWLVSRFPYAAASSTGRPTYGYIEGRTLFVIPIPDGDYTVRYTYFRLHPALSTSASELLIRCASRAVVAYATFWVFQSLEKSVDAEKWLVSYFKLLESAKRVDAGNSAVQQAATPRDDRTLTVNEYWLDPFVRQMP